MLGVIWFNLAMYEFQPCSRRKSKRNAFTKLISERTRGRDISQDGCPQCVCTTNTVQF